MGAIPIDEDVETADPELLRTQPMHGIPLPDASSNPMEMPSGVIGGSRTAMPMPIGAAPRPQVMSSGGIPVTPQTPRGIIPTDNTTGQPTQLNNKGIPIKAGLAGLWAKADNINNPVLRVLGKIGTGALKAIDVAGQAAVPRIESAIPGSAGFEQRQIAGRQAAADEVAKRGLETAQTDHLNAETEAAGQPKPKEETWEVTPHFTGPNGEPVEVEKNSGTMRVGGTEIPGIKGAEKPEKEEKLNDFEKYYKDYITDNNLPDSAHNRLLARKEYAAAAREPKGEAGTWQPMEQDGKSVLYNSKTGEVKAAPAGLAKPGTAAKVEQKSAGAKTALAYATDYGSRTAHTGSGDEALMEKFFELAKPETGFRMTQSQIDMLKNSQGWMNSLAAKTRHATSGTWFSDQQRSEIVQTMKDLAKANGLDENGKKTSNGGGDATPIRFQDGADHYDIPADKKEKFLKAHPNAKQVQ